MCVITESARGEKLGPGRGEFNAALGVLHYLFMSVVCAHLRIHMHLIMQLTVDQIAPCHHQTGVLSVQ